MSYFNYVNSFHEHAEPQSDPPSTQFDPGVDIDLVTGDQNVLGPMVLASTDKIDGGPVVTDFDATEEGLYLGQTNYSLAPPAASKTIYVVSKDKFEYAPFLHAELDFDLPNCLGFDDTKDTKHTYDYVPTAAVWAVGLNFKTGDETDNPLDVILRIGPTCQFRDGGNIRFHTVTNMDPMSTVYAGTYEGYGDTIFTLKVQMSRNDTSVEAYAWLLLNSQIIASGQLASRGEFLGDEPLQSLEGARDDTLKITAIGVSLANMGPIPGQSSLIPRASVRLRQFRLRYPLPRAITEWPPPPPGAS